MQAAELDGATSVVGRRFERERLGMLVAAARRGAGGALALHGEAGVGKSVLLRHLRESAAGFQGLWATGVQGEVELAFATVADLIGPLLDSIGTLPSPQAAALRSALRLDDEPVADRFAAYSGLRSLLSSAAHERPVLVLVDDAHWIDASSREALLFCARRATEMAAAFVFAVRDGAGTPLDQTGVEQLSIHGLSEEDSVALVTSAAPATAPAVARALYQGTAGNPLALVELARELSPAQAAGREPLPTPLRVGARLQVVFAERLRRLPRQTQAALVVAAASDTGRLDTIGDALRSAGFGRSAMGPAEEIGLVAVVDGLLVWRHPLVRSAAYHSAAPADRRAAHAALAKAARDDSLDDHRAWHLAAAADAPDEAVAAELDDLARRATRRGGTAVVVRALETAARLTPSAAQRARRLLSAAEAAVATGDGPRATGLLDAAERDTDDGRLRSEIERIRARLELMSALPQAAHDRLVRAAAQWEETDPAFASELLAEAVVARMAQGGRDQYLGTAARAFAVGRRAGPTSEPLPGIVYAMGLIAVGQSEQGIELLDRYSAVVESPELWQAAPEIVAMVAFTWIWVERFAEAERLVSAMIARARTAGAARALGLPLAVLGELNHRHGRWPVAHELMTESVRVAEDVGEGALLANCVCWLARVEAGLGNVDRARAHADRGLALCRAQQLGAIEPHAHYALGLLAMSQGEYGEAVRELAAIDPTDEFGQDPGLAIWEPERIEALVRTGRRDEAERQLERYERNVLRTNRVRGGAMLRRLRGLLGTDVELDEHFGDALEWHTRIDCPFEEARTRLAYGERLRRARRRSDAQAQLAAAQHTFDELGARLFAERARDELGAAGGRTAAAAAGPGDAADPWNLLTASERRVAEVIVGGATYNEAAAALFLSPRTIEHHLRQAYRKLGVRSRGELAARLTRRS